VPKSTLQAKMNSSTAAAADNEKRDDQDPDPVGVVVEYAAKTVVVHICFPPNVRLRAFLPA
jgi:hypothetical protein